MSEFNSIQGKDFARMGGDQLDLLVLGEERAKLGMLTGILAGVNVVYVGEPGGGKTTLGMDAYRLIDGIGEGSLAEIPALADLAPRQVVGGKSESTQVTKYSDGSSEEKTTSADMSPIITRDTKWIFANEINQTAPHAVSSMLEAIESGKVTTTAGTHTLDGLQVVVATMNPGEQQQGSFKMTKKLASRFPIGVVMGDEQSAFADEMNGITAEILDGWEPRPEQVRSVISVEQLKQLRAEAKRIPFADSVRDNIAVPAVNALNDSLRADGRKVNESRKRMAKQLGSLSRALASLRAEEHVTPQEIADAAHFMITARFGILDPRVEALTEEAFGEVQKATHLPNPVR